MKERPKRKYNKKQVIKPSESSSDALALDDLVVDKQKNLQQNFPLSESSVTGEVEERDVKVQKPKEQPVVQQAVQPHPFSIPTEPQPHYQEKEAVPPPPQQAVERVEMQCKETSTAFEAVTFMDAATQRIEEPMMAAETQVDPVQFNDQLAQTEVFEDPRLLVLQ